LYDLGFPLPRSWLYGLGGFVVVTAAFAIGLVVANSGPAGTAEVEGAAAIVADESADDVIVVRPSAESAHFPAFAPEGVIVVSAPSRDERAFAEDRERIETARRRAQSNETRPPVAVARAEPRARELDARTEEAHPETRADERLARNEAPPVRENEETEYADAEATQEESDNRSWYGSAEYRREVQERRRAEREARRRRNDGR
jgi:hypothetical protein